MDDRLRDLFTLLIFLAVISASFYAGFHFRTIDNYVCFSYVDRDSLGNTWNSRISPKCLVNAPNSSLNCSLADGMLSYTRGVYIGPDPPVKVQNYSGNGYLYYSGNDSSITMHPDVRDGGNVQ